MNPLPEQPAANRTRWTDRLASMEGPLRVHSSLVAFGALACAMLAAVVVLVRSTWAPYGDFGFVQLHVLDAWSTEHPLVGIRSTVSADPSRPAHHPGPLQFWLLALPFRSFAALGVGTSALLLAQATIGVAAVAGVAVALHRVRSWQVALVASIFVVTTATVAGLDPFVSPSNADWALVTLTLAIAAALGVAHDPTSVGLVVAANVLSVASMQAHLSYVLPGAAVCVVVDAWHCRATPATVPHGRARCAALVGGLQLALWSGPILDVLVHGGGNVRSLMTTDVSAAAGWPAAFDRLANSFAPWEFAFRRLESGTPFGQAAQPSAAVLAMVVLAALVAVALRADGAWYRRSATLALGVMAGTCAAAAMAPESLATAFAVHVQQVWIPVNVLTWAVLLLSAAHGIHHRTGTEVARRAGAVTFLLAAIASSLVAFDAAALRGKNTMCRRAVRQLVDDAPDWMSSSDVIDITRTTATGLSFVPQTVIGFVAEMVRRNGDVRVAGPIAPAAVREHRWLGSTVAAPEPTDAVVVDAAARTFDRRTGPSWRAAGGRTCTVDAEAFSVISIRRRGDHP